MLVVTAPFPAPALPTRHRSPRRAAWALAAACAIGAMVWSLWPAPQAADALAALRQAAALGDADASVALAGALLDRHEASGDAGALVEALQWIARDLDTPAMLSSPQLQRVVQGSCAREPLLQWHWLCEQGE